MTFQSYMLPPFSPNASKIKKQQTLLLSQQHGQRDIRSFIKRNFTRNLHGVFIVAIRIQKWRLASLIAILKTSTYICNLITSMYCVRWVTAWQRYGGDSPSSLRIAGAMLRLSFCCSKSAMLSLSTETRSCSSSCPETNDADALLIGNHRSRISPFRIRVCGRGCRVAGGNVENMHCFRVWCNQGHVINYNVESFANGCGAQ